MNINLDKEQFMELVSVYIVEEAKARGKEYIGTDPNDLTEYEQLLAHIAKYPMKMQLKMGRYRVEQKIKTARFRLDDAMAKTDSIRLIV